MIFPLFPRLKNGDFLFSGNFKYIVNCLNNKDPKKDTNKTIIKTSIKTYFCFRPHKQWIVTNITNY